MSRRQHIHTAWRWLKDELARRLGQEAADQLWLEYSRRAQQDKAHNDRVDAPENLARLESYARTRAADSAELRRLQKRIARLRALLDTKDKED
jgi:hypothetical protein